MLAERVIAALEIRQPLSVVRMSDGEEKILSYCKRMLQTMPVLQFEKEWRVRFGIDGITCGEMRRRLEYAATKCTYFAPDGGDGFFTRHFPIREPLAEIYYPSRWTRTQRAAILKAAGTSVLVVNRDPQIAYNIENSPFNRYGVRAISIDLPDWQASRAAIYSCSKHTSPLVFVSGGPANKYIIPEIAEQGKVVLDMGSGAKHFWCTVDNPACGERACGAVAEI